MNYKFKFLSRYMQEEGATAADDFGECGTGRIISFNFKCLQFRSGLARR